MMNEKLKKYQKPILIFLSGLFLGVLAIGVLNIVLEKRPSPEIPPPKEEAPQTPIPTKIPSPEESELNKIIREIKELQRRLPDASFLEPRLDMPKLDVIVEFE